MEIKTFLRQQRSIQNQTVQPFTGEGAYHGSTKPRTEERSNHPPPTLEMLPSSLARYAAAGQRKIQPFTAIFPNFYAVKATLPVPTQDEIRADGVTLCWCPFEQAIREAGPLTRGVIEAMSDHLSGTKKYVYIDAKIQYLNLVMSLSIVFCGMLMVVLLHAIHGPKRLATRCYMIWQQGLRARPRHQPTLPTSRQAIVRLGLLPPPLPSSYPNWSRILISLMRRYVHVHPRTRPNLLPRSFGLMESRCTGQLRRLGRVGACGFVVSKPIERFSSILPLSTVMGPSSDYRGWQDDGSLLVSRLP